MAKRPTFVLNKLTEAGYEAYFVGGCVRDTLLGREVHDWDMTTSALPEQIMAVFPKCVPTGMKHGTVTVVENDEMYEVTTFRCDGDYADGRHPKNVKFVRNLQEDLSRRDFTVNAMAMDAEGNVTDLFGGREDLSSKILRCVGDPETRFREDALRMLRALRFSAQLGFSVEEKTFAAIVRCAPLCRTLSVERVRDEVEKTLLSSAPEMVEEMLRLGVLCAVGLQTGAYLSELKGMPADRTVRWAAFFRDCPEAGWETLRLDKKTGRTARCSASLSGTCQTRIQWKKLISENGADVGLCTAALDGETAMVEEILASGECLFVRDLAVSGRDFSSVQGREVGVLLKKLLDHVLAHPEDNNRRRLLKLAGEM